MSRPLSFGVLILLTLTSCSPHQPTPSIDSFNECVEAGFPVMETHPERCSTDEGRVFINIPDPEA